MQPQHSHQFNQGTFSMWANHRKYSYQKAAVIVQEQSQVCWITGMVNGFRLQNLGPLPPLWEGRSMRQTNHSCCSFRAPNPLETARWALPTFFFVTLHCFHPFCPTNLLQIEFFWFDSVVRLESCLVVSPSLFSVTLYIFASYRSVWTLCLNSQQAHLLHVLKEQLRVVPNFLSLIRAKIFQASLAIGTVVHIKVRTPGCLGLHVSAHMQTAKSFSFRPGVVIVACILSSPPFRSQRDNWPYVGQKSNNMSISHRSTSS